LQDGHVQTWYRLNRATIDAASFIAFMKSVRTNWLDPRWEQEVKLLILGSSQGTKPIADWIMLVESTNALLLGHTCALSQNDLRNQIQSHIHPDTMTVSTTAELHLITDYEKYKPALKVIDDARIRADELLKVAVKQMMATTLSTNTTLPSAATPVPPLPAPPPHPLPLTAALLAHPIVARLSRPLNALSCLNTVAVSAAAVSTLGTLDPPAPTASQIN
jgi:hypothetical protein